MIICLCNALNEKRIRNEIRDGAATLRLLRKRCGAGGSCGQCVCDLKDMLSEAKTEDAHSMVKPAIAV